MSIQLAFPSAYGPDRDGYVRSRHREACEKLMTHEHHRLTPNISAEAGQDRRPMLLAIVIVVGVLIAGTASSAEPNSPVQVPTGDQANVREERAKARALVHHGIVT